MTEQQDELESLTSAIVKAMQDKKAQEIVELDLRQLPNRVVDKFIICHADNDRQVEAIASAVEDETLKQLREKPWQKEGYENKEWILLDYVNIVVHVFLNEKRSFYGLEELWGDAIFHKHDEHVPTAQNN